MVHGIFGLDDNLVIGKTPSEARLAIRYLYLPSWGDAISIVRDGYLRTKRNRLLYPAERTEYRDENDNIHNFYFDERTLDEIVPFYFDNKCDPINYVPHVEYTDLRPEQGKEIIMHRAFPGLSLNDINYGLEFLVDTKGERRERQGVPNAIQFFGEYNLPIRVLRTWDMAKVESRRRNGVEVIRKIIDGIPIAYYQ